MTLGHNERRKNAMPIPILTYLALGACAGVFVVCALYLTLPLITLVIGLAIFAVAALGTMIHHRSKNAKKDPPAYRDFPVANKDGRREFVRAGCGLRVYQAIDDGLDFSICTTCRCLDE
jgi:hypothetical protein